MNSNPSTNSDSAVRRWSIVVTLLFATAINYMDRQTLANLSIRITTELNISQEQYGTLELGFGWGFAAGSLLFGFVADWVGVRWLYPFALFMWSAAGFMTGYARTYDDLFYCRISLGFFEAGHWPCALKTTQLLLLRSSRTLGNSILQSGASIGAVLTPLIILGILSRDPIPGEWRLPFKIIGATGLLWILAWTYLMVGRRLDSPIETSQSASSNLRSLFFDSRFLVLLVMVVCLNATWQALRAWMPKFLVQGRGYREGDMLWMMSAYYIITDIGCFAAGGFSAWLASRNFGVHRSRVFIFAVATGLTSFVFLSANLPKGDLLLFCLSMTALGSLALFPCYYSLTQEFGDQYMGRITGILAAFGWFVSSPFQKLFGYIVDQNNQSFDLAMILTGIPPLISLGALLLLWKDRT
jgi:MFS transporter, ACS family, hexuronate transporter